VRDTSVQTATESASPASLYILSVSSAEDFRYGVAINRIRNYYKQIADDQAKLFLLSGHDDGRGVFENAAVPPEGRKQFFTFATSLRRNCARGRLSRTGRCGRSRRPSRSCGTPSRSSSA
jgi:hypothetical protein